MKGSIPKTRLGDVNALLDEMNLQGEPQHCDGGGFVLKLSMGITTKRRAELEKRLQELGLGGNVVNENPQ